MGRADQAISRTTGVRIKLAPEMVERLEKIALDMGMPVSTMAAFAIGQWINQQEQNRSVARMAALELARSMGTSLDENMANMDSLIEAGLQLGMKHALSTSVTVEGVAQRSPGQ